MEDSLEYSMENGDRDWIVCVTDEAVPRIREIAGRIAAMGAEISRVIGAAGVIGCRCPDSTAVLIRSIEGVEAVEREMQARLPPVPPAPF